MKLTTLVLALLGLLVAVNGQCEETPTPTPPLNECPEPFDVVFILDETCGATEYECARYKDNLKAMISAFEVGNRKIRVGIVGYGDNGRTVVYSPLGRGNNRRRLLRAVDKVNCSSLSVYSLAREGFDEAVEQYERFWERKGRASVVDRYIVWYPICKPDERNMDEQLCHQVVYDNLDQWDISVLVYVSGGCMLPVRYRCLTDGEDCEWRNRGFNSLVYYEHSNEIIEKICPIVTTNQPSQTPTDMPSNEPTFNPTEEPTRNPTRIPTEEPTQEPTRGPSSQPTNEPTESPTEQPTMQPSRTPTGEPTEEPTRGPTRGPTQEPTDNPTTTTTTTTTTAAPTEEPTESPTTTTTTTSEPTLEPTEGPTHGPTEEPTESPTTTTTTTTAEPTEEPTESPTTTTTTAEPSISPTIQFAPRATGENCPSDAVPVYEPQPNRNCRNQGTIEINPDAVDDKIRQLLIERCWIILDNVVYNNLGELRGFDWHCTGRGCSNLDNGITEVILQFDEQDTQLSYLYPIMTERDECINVADTERNQHHVLSNIQVCFD